MDFSLKSKPLSMTATEASKRPSLWHPLRAPTFRNLLIADVASDVGTLMQKVIGPQLLHQDCGNQVENKPKK